MNEWMKGEKEKGPVKTATVDRKSDTPAIFTQTNALVLV